MEEECELTELPKSMCAHCKGVTEENSTHKWARCKNCGSEDVTWALSEVGNYYLKEILADGTLSVIPHFKRCTGGRLPDWFDD